MTRPRLRFLLSIFVGELLCSFYLPNLLAEDRPAATTFAVIGDYGAAGTEERDVAALVHKWKPDFIITTGDNNYPEGAAKTIDANIGQYYHDYIYPYLGQYGAGAQQNRFFPCLGNHDWYSENAQPYFDYFTLPGNERYYEMDWSPVAFFVIDSDPHEPDGRDVDSLQAHWLHDRLSVSTATWKIITMHHPPYSSGWHHGSEKIMRWPYKEWGADLVLSGHEHSYERLEEAGLTYVVIGFSGNNLYQFKPALPQSKKRFTNNWGAAHVIATDHQLTVEVVTRSHDVIDRFVINKP